MGNTALILPGRRDKMIIRSAVLMASDRSWVIKMAVFPVCRMMLLMSSQTESRV